MKTRLAVKLRLARAVRSVARSRKVYLGKNPSASAAVESGEAERGNNEA